MTTQGVPSTLIDAVNHATSASTAAPAKQETTSQSQFLQLFVAQLQHQDPLSPMEPNDLTAQLAQFSSLEQLTAINTHLDAMTASTKQTTTTALLGLIGKQVRFDGSQLTITGGQTSEVRYTLTDQAEKVAATIRAADGTVVRGVDLGSQTAGTQTFQFDGKDQNGRTLPDGTYTIEMAAQAPGAKVATPLDLVVEATVDGVDLASDTPALLVGGTRVPLDKVQEVHVSNR
jgi:flagellar basal-body rod modification protein FlgD